MEETTIRNYINGRWVEPGGGGCLEVVDPATGRLLGVTRFSSPADVDQAAQAAFNAFENWRRVPAGERVQYLFKLKALMETHFEELARSITIENGKVLDDAKGEMRRAVENVETACGIPSLMKGDFSEDAAAGIDEYMIRQPVGVAASICPFNFPGMIPFWYMPYALAAGNTVIIKPSERTPLTMLRIFSLMEECGFPAGVINLVHGGADTVNAILDHPLIQAVTFVGSTPVARHVYARASASGKRVQAQGGAKNPLVILPDADVEMTTRIVMDSVYGNAGQRCLAASNIILVGEAEKIFKPLFIEAAQSRLVGNGLEPKVQMGPVISHKSKERIQALIDDGLKQGASLLVDGRNPLIPGGEGGFFLRPSVVGDVRPENILAQTEVFGPLMCLMHMDTLEEAIRFINSGKYGNMAAVFTASGAAARKLRYEVQAGNIGINIGVAAPMAYYPFSGWKDSFFGTLHGQSSHAVEFFTQTKVVVERWFKDWSRQF
jgi:malonate-semialdehyde dehydrogenase (acetylating)/methylmalonate-semialdehyde dehydrogenase